MPTALDGCFREENLHRAWRFLLSNPSASYKNFFRSLYSNYSIASDRLIANLSDRLRRGLFRPAHSCKVYLPKASGGLRPYTLLTVEDQIAYQAFVNIIAGKFRSEVKSWYGSKVFSHMLASPSSDFFYQKWQKGYAAFNREARKAWNEGLRFAAHFDLTACYDSLDHRVIQQLLQELGCGQDFCQKFVEFLSHWTATGNKNRIYQGHGIPQGPISSGLVAEVVLHHFDKMRRFEKVYYQRYVDDIRLFAKSEKELRRAVFQLDLESKRIGLFPQSAKIEIHEVKDIEKELKTIVSPDADEEEWTALQNDQDKVHERLVDLTPNNRVTDPTRFKHCLGGAEPRPATNQRLWHVFDNHPDLYGNVLSYFRKHQVLPMVDARELVQRLNADDLIAVRIAELLKTANGRIRPRELLNVDQVVAKHAKNMKRLPCDLAAIVGSWAIKRKLLDAGAIEKAIRHHPEWYTRAMLSNDVNNQSLPQPQYNEVLRANLDDEVSDVAIASAARLAEQETLVDVAEPMHVVAGLVLDEFGVIAGKPHQVCGITRAFDRLLGKKSPRIDWKRFFGRRFGEAEKKAIRWTGYFSVDATSWVNSLDVFCDLWLYALHLKNPSLGTYTLGNIGSIVGSLGQRQLRTYPGIFRLAAEIHSKRHESDLSHPVRRRGPMILGPTSFIPFRYFKKAIPFFWAALKEMVAGWPLPQPVRRTRRVVPSRNGAGEFAAV